MSRRDLFDLVLLAAIWGASFLFMRMTVSEFGPFGLIAVRVSIAAMFLVAVLAVRPTVGPWPKKIVPFFLLGAINTAIPFVLFAYATKTLPAGYASVINATVPLFGALIAVSFSLEKISLQKALGLVTGFAGVMVLVSQKLTIAADRLAVAAGLLAALLYGVAAFYSKKHFAGENPLVVATGSLVAATALLVPFAVAAWPSTPPSASAWFYGIVLGVVCTGIAYLLYFRLINHVGPTKAITVTYLIPVFGMLWGYLVLSEAITWNMLAGCMVVLIGTTLVVRSRHTQAAPVAAASDGSGSKLE